jgi:peptide/nickel transport system permease protein
MLIAGLTIFGLSLFVFALLRVIPGDAAAIQLADSAASPEQEARVRRQLGLDKGIAEQYLTWATRALRGDLGDSFFTGRSVVSELSDRAPVSLELAVGAIAVAIIIGLPVGTLAALYRDRPIDQVFRVISVLGLAIPAFWLGTMVMIYSARWFDWIPPVGYTSPLQNPARNVEQFLIPCLIIGWSFSASLTRMTRSALLEVLGEDYMRTARAKGLRSTTVILRHALKNAMIPVVTIFGLQLGAVITGVVIVENIFNFPGLGRLSLDAIQKRDYPMVQGIVLMTGITIITINLTIDLAYAWLDPRIRYGAK